MESEVVKKKIPVLTIISATLTVVTIILFFAVIWTYSLDSGVCRILFLFSLVLTIISFTFVFQAKRERLKGIWIPLLAINACILALTPLVGVIGSITAGINESKEQKQAIADKMASVENLKEHFTEGKTKLFLYDDSCDEDPFSYCDYNGTITNFFFSMNYTSTDYCAVQYYYPTVAFDNSRAHYTFSNDYCVLKINSYYEGGFLGGGRFTSTKYYKTNPEGASQFKQMISNEIQIQRAGCLEKQAEAKATTIRDASESLMNQPSIRCKKYGDEVEGNQYSYNVGKNVLRYLKELDPSTAPSIDEPANLSRKGFDITCRSDDTYEFYFHEQERCLEIKVYYLTPYEAKYRISVFFNIQEEDGNSLMEIVNQGMA